MTAAVAALLVGGLTGAATVLVHRDPGLLLLGAAATVAVLAVLPRGTTVPAFAAGWVVPVGVATVPRGGGGFLVALDLPGVVLLLLAVGVVVTGLARVRPRAS